MCAPFSVHDDNLIDAEAAQALDALMSAERKRLAIALLIANGATRFAFPRHDADDAIAASVAKVTEARFKLDRLIAGRALGEPCKTMPTAGFQCLALQERVTKNEAKANIHPLGPVLTAASRVDEPATSDQSLLAAAKGAGIRIPLLGDLDAGFHSPMAG